MKREGMSYSAISTVGHLDILALIQRKSVAYTNKNDAKLYKCIATKHGHTISKNTVISKGTGLCAQFLFKTVYHTDK